MFSYFGAKHQLTRWGRYPEPKYDLIIEPFAGSAGYSCRYGFDRDVLLIDCFYDVFDIWSYLIVATRKDIALLPDMQKGDYLSDIKQISEVERKLIAFCMNPGRPRPDGNKCTQFGESAWRGTKKRLLKNVEKINHWKIRQRYYWQAPNVEATWFIDPPYQNRISKGVKKNDYSFNKINYESLLQWIKCWKGEKFVCESMNNTWLAKEDQISIGNTNTSPGRGNAGKERIKTQEIYVTYGK